MFRFVPLFFGFVIFVSSCYALPPPLRTTLPGPPSDNITTSPELPQEPVNDTSVTAAEEGNRERESNTCPGCCKRKPGCNHVQNVDHVHALGFRRNDLSDWKSCRLPHFPEANHQQCFRTTVYYCDSAYSIHLKRRNVTDLNRRCPSEDPQGQLSHTQNQSRIFFNSPQYMCRNKNGRILKYRKHELCVYNISIPDCPSGAVVVKPTNDTQLLEERNNDTNTCRDYLQFYGEGGYLSRRYCGNELGDRDELVTIPSTNVLAVFWSNFSKYRTGFKLVAACKTDTY